jgi:hypothetical protein
MDGAYLQGVGDGTRPSEIKIIPSALENAEQFLASHEDDATTRRVQKVGRLIEGFETPYGMELLATVFGSMSGSSIPASDIDRFIRLIMSARFDGCTWRMSFTACAANV